MSTPLPMKVTLITAPQHPLGTLYYVWKQSRHNRPLPTPAQIEDVMLTSAMLKIREDYCWSYTDMGSYCQMLGFDFQGNGDVDKDIQALHECAKHIRDELEMIMNESIPVVENLHFVFHLENIPISLREQLVRHRIGTMIDPRVGADIVPYGMMADAPPGSLMRMDTVPDLAESTWWSQTSRVIPFSEFYDEGRFIVPASLKGKTVQRIAYGRGDNGEDLPYEQSAEAFYLEHLYKTQEAYKLLQGAGVHIEDCRNLIPVGATHGITWGLNLKAMLHIFGKRSSWIAQIGIWGTVMGMMAKELRDKVHPMFGMVLMPQCIKKGKYVGCPVSGTNAERVAGVDGMPPCPIWIRYQNDDALSAAERTYRGEFPGRVVPAWDPPNVFSMQDASEQLDIRNWEARSQVEVEMLESTAPIYRELWGFDVMEGVPDLSS